MYIMEIYISPICQSIFIMDQIKLLQSRLLCRLHKIYRIINYTPPITI